MASSDTLSLLGRERLVMIAGLLASDKIGKRTLAAAKATGILKRAGMIWEEALRLLWATRPSNSDIPRYRLLL